MVGDVNIEFVVKESEFKGKVIKQLYVVIDDKEFLIGTVKEKTDYGYINCVHKEFKEN